MQSLDSRACFQAFKNILAKVNASGICYLAIEAAYLDHYQGLKHLGGDKEFLTIVAKPGVSAVYKVYDDADRANVLPNNVEVLQHWTGKKRQFMMLQERVLKKRP